MCKFNNKSKLAQSKRKIVEKLIKLMILKLNKTKIVQRK